MTTTAPTSSTSPLHLNLTSPPIGTRTTITLERNSPTQGVSVITESSIVSMAPQDTPGCLGSIIGFFKRAWASICNWVLYVFRLFFPPSALSAITQVAQNIDQANREQREWLTTQSQQQREWMAAQAAQTQRAFDLVVTRLEQQRPVEQLPAPPVDAATPPTRGLAASHLGSSSPTPLNTSSTSSYSRFAFSSSTSPAAAATVTATGPVSEAALELATQQRRELLEAHKKLILLEKFILPTTKKDIKTEYDRARIRVEECIQKLEDRSLYSREGSLNVHTSLDRMHEVQSITKQANTLSQQLNSQPS